MLTLLTAKIVAILESRGKLGRVNFQKTSGTVTGDAGKN